MDYEYDDDEQLPTWMKWVAGKGKDLSFSVAVTRGVFIIIGTVCSIDLLLWCVGSGLPIELALAAIFGSGFYALVT